MTRLALLLLLPLLPALPQAGGGLTVFRSDVALVRVDAQVLDRDHRAVTELRREDFVLREDGREREIRNFAREEMPVDVLFLLDVSGSMRSHVERLAAASQQALRTLGPDDRVAIMVFDRSTRLRLGFRNRREGVDREFSRLLRQEAFNGGTDITRALLDAAEYAGREGRPEARRAIVILSDDQTERERDETRVEMALERADCILSALLAPDAMRNRTTRVPRGGGGLPLPFPGGGGGWGGVVLGPRYPRPSPASRTHSAGTAQIARASGGDSLPVDDAGALETTLSRIRQRYALFFLLPPGVRSGEQRQVELALQDAARRRFPDAGLRYRRSYRATQTTASTPPETTLGTTPATRGEAGTSTESPWPRPRRMGEDYGGPRGPNPAVGAPPQAQSSPPAGAKPAAPAASPAPQRGWRRVDEPEPPPPPPPAKPKR
jgi:VWFA-related protein